MNDKIYTSHRTAAFALLDGGYYMGANSRDFLKTIVFDLGPLTRKQSKWLNDLLREAKLPPFDRAARRIKL